MGRRADLIILNDGLVFVIEYKLGATRFDRSAIEQCHGYALDLKNFHETSHDLGIIPVLVGTHAQSLPEQPIVWADDQVATPLCLRPEELAGAVNFASRVWAGSDVRRQSGKRDDTGRRRRSSRLLRRSMESTP